MPAELSSNAYGKSAVRLVKIVRPESGASSRHRIWDLEVDVRLAGAEGVFDSAYAEGDNSRVLPTDTMKNTVYALARTTDFDSIETFAAVLARHFQQRNPHLDSAEVTIRQRPWTRIDHEGKLHDFAFEGSSGERTTARAVARQEAVTLEGGIDGLRVLKTTGSGFSGFPRDGYTTLVEAEDRILATTVQATWKFTDSATDGATDRATNPTTEGRRDFEQIRRTARSTMLQVFADHDSRSVQHTLYAMGQAVLDRLPDLAEIHLRLPNQHHFPVDLSPFDLDNPDQIFLAVDEPFGLIEGTIRRT